MLSIAENRKICVVSSEYELHLGLELANELDDVFVDGLTVQIVLGLVDQNQVVVLLLSMKIMSAEALCPKEWWRRSLPRYSIVKPCGTCHVSRCASSLVK